MTNSLIFHEKKQHGTLEFPAEYHHLDHTHPRYHMPSHWHKEWELIRIIQGTFTIHADEQEIIAGEGDILLIRDNMLHGGIPVDCVYECFLFDLHSLFRGSELIKKYFRPIYRLEILPDILYRQSEHPKLYALVSELMEANFQHSTDPDYHELITVSCLSQLFTHILTEGLYATNTVGNISASHKIGQIKSVLEYIEQQYQRSISLEELADIAGLNPKYFCRLFREITMQTPLDYVIHLRIEQAAKLLSTTNLSIIDIGMECGFNDCSYFIRTFKKLRQVTPNQYRKLNMTTLK
ncbi:MAG: AraC family transcriptional regulator [Lachnospiraceae bacterium]|nr:AraC family transcriptional regulator [Lachnospiraceae bacterium]